MDSIRTSADDVKAGASLATNIISRLANVLVFTSDYNTQGAEVLKFSFRRCIKWTIRFLYYTCQHSMYSYQATVFQTKVPGTAVHLKYTEGIL